MSQDFTIQVLGADFGDSPWDISFDNIGDPPMISGVNKLVQDIEKIIYTINCPTWPAYGTDVESAIGTNIGVAPTKALLYTKVQQALNYLQALQKEQLTYQVITADEYLKQIVNITVDYQFELTGLATDLNSYKITISVMNAANNQLNISAITNLVPNGS